MRVQNISPTITGNAFANTAKNAKPNNARVNSAEKETKSQNAVVFQLSPKSQFDKMIEKMREQIQKIQENEHYDADTKKSKIEELEKQIEELEKAKAELAAQSLSGQAKKAENGADNANGTNTNTAARSANNTSKEKVGSDGDILELNTQALIQADNSLKNLKEAHSVKVKSEGEARVLTSEIKIDKGRGVDTTRKEEQLARTKETTEKSIADMGKAIKDANRAAKNITKHAETGEPTEAEPTIVISNESPVDEEEKTGTTSAVMSDATNEQKTEIKINENS